MAYPEHGADYKNKPAWLDRAVAAERPSEQARLLKDAMDAQGREALDISDAVPRREEKRADGGMINSKLSQVAPEFEPAAAQDAREAAATRIRRGANDRLKTMNSPMKRMAASDPEL